MAQLVHGVGVVEKVGVWAADYHLSRNVHDGFHVPEGMKLASRSAVLAVDLLDSMLAENREIHGPVNVSAYFDGVYDEVGPIDGKLEVAGGVDVDRSA